MKKSLLGLGVKLKGLLGKKMVGGYQRECVVKSEGFYEKQSEVNFYSREEEEGRGGKKRKKRIGIRG